MKFETLVNKTVTPATVKHACVLSSRVRLARNVQGYSFPGPMTKSGFNKELSELNSLQKQVLVEQHLISRELAAKNVGCGIVVNKEKTIAVMINEEDHFRLQSIQHGFNLKKAYRSLNKIDDQLSGSLHYAYDETLGFLTSCPSNLGTGLRASVMLHLPALTISEQIQPVLKAVSKLGLAIRGIYGEGTESMGHYYQISNQSTLGESEAEIIERIERMVKQIITAEENARQKLLIEQEDQLNDKIGRAYGVLKHAKVISSKEALDLLSLLRLGTDAGMFPEEHLKTCDHLMMYIQPAHLQFLEGGKLEMAKRDKIRAKIISSHLQTVNPPDIIKNKPEGTEENPLL